MEIITSHTNTDFDGLAAMVAASKLHPGAQLVLPGAADRNVREFLALHGDMVDVKASKQLDLSSVSKVIVVDTQTRSRLGEFERLLTLPGVEVVVYDHHALEPMDIPNARLVYREVGAATTILVQEIRSQCRPVSSFEATLFALGIYEDTGSLTFHTTTALDLETVAWLLSQGANLDVVADFIHRALSEEQRRLLNELVLSSRIVEVNGTPVTLASAAARGYVGEVALMAHRLRELENTPAVFVLAQMDDSVYVVGRSSTDRANVGLILQALGGGGHSRAASAQVKGASLAQVERMLLEALARHLPPEPTASTIMSRPPRVIGPNAMVSEAVQAMQRYGHSGLCVVDCDRVVGVITRRDADKARHHGLMHAPVKGFMSRDVAVAAPTTPLTDLERMMIHRDVGRIPVVDDGKLVGVVTRSDLLRALHGQRYVEEPVNLTPVLEAGLPAGAVELLRLIGARCEDEGAPAYLVGGIVRDLLLGRPNLDIDIVIEGDAEILAAKLSSELGAALKTHKRFGTAHLRMPDGLRIDIAAARTESYRRPAALPDVEHSSIQDDLRRRDFTMNALAVKIGFSRFGELLDPFGGKRDIGARVVRTMHNLSFIDDPTRIVRAVRFEVRLGFRMDEQTEALAAEAVRTGALGRLTPERFRRELLLCFSEPSLVDLIRRLSELGILKHLHPELDADPDLVLSAGEALTWYASLHQRDRLDREVVFLSALLFPLGPAAAREVCADRLRLSPPRCELVGEIVGAAPGLARDVAGLANAELYERLHDQRVEAIVLAVALRPDDSVREAFARYLRNLRHVKLSVRGDDLIAMGYKPGPAFGAAFREALLRKVSGELHGRSDEIAFILRRLSELEVRVAT